MSDGESYRSQGQREKHFMRFMVLLYSKNANIVYIGSNGGKDTCQAYLVLHCYLQFLKFQTYLILYSK